VDCLAIRKQYDTQIPVSRFRHQRPASNTTVSHLLPNVKGNRRAAPTVANENARGGASG